MKAKASSVVNNLLKNEPDNLICSFLLFLTVDNDMLHNIFSVERHCCTCPLSTEFTSLIGFPLVVGYNNQCLLPRLIHLNDGKVKFGSWNFFRYGI